MTRRGNYRRFGLLFVLSILCLLLGACVPKIERLQDEEDTEALIKLLSYKRKAEVRMEAAVALGEMKAEEAVDPLIERLDDEDEGVRAAAAVALGSIGDQSVIPELINQLKDESAVARGGAAEALVMFEVQAVDAVIGSLSSSDAAFRGELVHVLTEIGDPAIPSLLDALSNPAQTVRQGANDALVAMGSPAATFLVSHYTGIEKGIQGTIKAILVDMGEEAVDSLIDGLGEENQVVVEMAGETLVAIGQPAIQPLIDSLQDESLVWQAENVLVTIGDPAVSPLIDALADPDIQNQAGDVLIRMGGSAMDDLIAKYESDPDAYQNILRPLVYGLRLDDDLRDQIHAIMVEIGEEVVPYILTMAKESNMVVVGGRIFYAHEVLYSPYGTAIGFLMDGGLCEEIIESEGQIVLCRRGENYFIDKVMAVQQGGGVGVIIYNDTEGVLYPTLGEDNDAQIVSLGLTMEDGEALLESMIGEFVFMFSEDISQVPFTLAEIGTPAIPYLIEVIRDGELLTIAEDTLIEIGPPTAPFLLEALEEEEASVQVELLYIMGEINDERFHEPAIEALEHSDPLVREAAAYALARMMIEESIEPLIAKLVDEDEYVVYAAQYALTKIGLPAVDTLLSAYHEEDLALTQAAESVLRDIFEENAADIEEMAAGVCSGVSQPEASEYSRYESDIHPMVVISEDGDLHYWTDYIPVDWLPFTAADLELVVCATDQEKQVVQVCQYYYTGSGGAAPSITRYRYEMTVKLFAAHTGYLVGSTTLRGTSPDYCPYTTSSSTTQISGDYVSLDDFRTWISVYGISLEE